MSLYKNYIYTMNDDWALFIPVIVLMTLMIMLCYYLQNWAVAQKDWVNLKCNPLYMLINSISTDNKTALTDFNACVKQVQ